MQDYPWNHDGYWFNVAEAEESLTVETGEEAWGYFCNAFGSREEFDAWMWEMRNIVATHDAFDGAGF